MFISHIISIILTPIVLWFNVLFELIRLLFKRRAALNIRENVVVITGCDSGFGEMAAKQLAEKGFHVVACCLTENGIKNIENKVALAILCNVTNEKDIENVYNKTKTYCEEKNCKVWALINNAGLSDGSLLDWTTMKSFRFVFDVNVFGVIHMTKTFLPLLKYNKNSRIINLSSLAGILPCSMMTAYAASKHAVEGFAKGLRAELKPWNIHVCNVNPGFMKTPILISGPEAAKKCYLNSPEDIQKQYDIDAIQASSTFVDTVKENPQLVIDAIIDGVLDNSPPLWFFPGYQSMIARY